MLQMAAVHLDPTLQGCTVRHGERSLSMASARRTMSCECKSGEVLWRVLKQTMLW
jgi:hypothetical protein